MADEAGAPVVRLVRNLSLEENREVINVSPRVVFDPQGGYLVADNREAQLRRYSPTGSLLWYAGGKGEGPGEYYGPTKLVRLPSGRLLASDWFLKFVVYSDSGELVRTISAPFARIEDIELVHDSALVVSATLGRSPDSPWLHIWSLARDTTLRSFFFPVSRAANRYAAELMGWVNIDVRGDTIAAVFPAMDSIFFFTIAGHSLPSLPLPPRLFRSVPPETPSDVEEPLGRAEWLSTFDILQDVHYLSNGDILLQYFAYSKNDPTLASRTWHWLLYRRDSQEFHEIDNASRLLAVDTESDSMIVITPGSEVPNRWSMAHMVVP